MQFPFSLSSYSYFIFLSTLILIPTCYFHFPYTLFCFPCSMFPFPISKFLTLTYAGNPESWRSVTGYLIYVNGCPVAWRSRQQKVTSLSSYKSEYYAITEVTTEMMYVKHFFDFLKIEVQLSMTIQCDNQRAVFLSKEQDLYWHKACGHEKSLHLWACWARRNLTWVHQYQE